MREYGLAYSGSAARPATRASPATCTADFDILLINTSRPTPKSVPTP